MLDCNLLKKLSANNSSTPGQGKKDLPSDGSAKFPKETACLMIFGGPSGYESSCRQKLTIREVNAIEPTVPQYLQWYESAISFDCSDHPNHIPHPGRFPLVVDQLVCDVYLTKVLIDGGSGLNILYVKTLDDMKILH